MGNNAMSLRKSINYFSRKLLNLWVRTEVYPDNPDALLLVAEAPVVYVLESRSWSSLLVLESQCEQSGLPQPLSRIADDRLVNWHSVYTIAPREPFKAWLNREPKRSRMLRGIAEILAENPELDVQFIPVSVFWGRPVAKQSHWMKVMFADSWRLTGSVRKLFTILLHGRSTVIKFSEPVSYQDILSRTKSSDECIDELQTILSGQLTAARQATLGPDMSHRRTLLRKLLLKPDVQKAISKRASEDNRTEYQATLQARRYLREIVANCTEITISVMQRLLGAFWNRFYSGIEVSNSEAVKKLALTHEIVYLPCHRSHIDYLLLSYAIYFEGLAIPYIAAGKNLNMPIIGTILRGGGAFFIRRTFKGNELYSTVLFEYLAELVGKGVPIEYFVEGGRSRTGRMLKPKPGMLSMTIRAFLKYRKRPLAFVPVYIGYEKLMESKAYQAELAGEEKQSETFFNSIRSMLRIRGRYGKVHVNFSAPVYLGEVLDHEQPSWMSVQYDDVNRPLWLKGITGSIAESVMTRINEAATVNAINLVATVLLSAQNQSMDEQELLDVLELYKKYILSLNYSPHLKVTRENGKELIERALYLKMVKRRKHELGDIIQVSGNRKNAFTYYRNNVLHLMALPSIVACCFINKRTMSRRDIQDLIGLVYPFLKSELFLTWDRHQLPDVIEVILRQMEADGLLTYREEDKSYSRSGTAMLAQRKLSLLSKVILPVLEVYYLTLALLSRKGGETIPKETLQRQCQLMAQRISMTHEMNSPDYSDLHLISNFVETLITMDYVKVYGTENLGYSEIFEKTDRRIRLLLGKDIRTHILQIIKK